MSKVILGLTISLDGFAEDINGSVNPLYSDLEQLEESEVMTEFKTKTGAVVMSGKEFYMADDLDGYADGYEFQGPIFIFTDKVPDKHPKENDLISFTFVTSGVDDAIREAKVVAGDKDVNIIGSALTAQLCLKTDLIDELQVDIIPRFLNEGYRPFDNIGDLNKRVERILVKELPAGRVHIRYNILTIGKF
ncbi:MAG: riboflavin biosynthesis protein RibD [Fusobacteria bacterium]|nr:MAG: riboflavin biosynthesis protein RibD [Fusobacteriota bacterium]KAF0229128.1 MAG: riboflavin biosynthesis protein [Fusobacteriota bacterium]